ncbi:PREDICTED: alkylated DNA repair protein alkB homolog 8 [Nicrophorus vespilloides]|uniref:tRNA (carboxymethyluridine(34)-5-O)-methyltransferase n=1 Tax=Nicrophorus vespilloides TaxID=110193 RepID=A0ABM1MN28_NICVS|nr:PREDICTED: alkylated DNA repair protein alkB homolog 8 [Nicrophorus vespilloides]
MAESCVLGCESEELKFQMEPSGNSLKKLERKMRKCHAVVEKETGIPCSTSNPTKNVVVCNSGLSNGLTEEVVMESFMSFGTLDRIIMLPGKSCCFVVFKNLANAKDAFEHINGKLKIAQDNKPILLGYSETLPAVRPIDFRVKPPGLKVVPDFISEAEEELLLSLVNFDEDEGGDGVMKHRQVKHFGFEFRYDINNVDKDAPLEVGVPAECDFLWDRLKSRGLDFRPDQLTVNHYKPGQGIPPHVDTHSAFDEPLLSVSLSSDIVMDFRHRNGKHLPVFVPRRSLTIMNGESRYDWTHGITPRKLDVVPSEKGITANERGVRVSFTFRRIRQGECECIYKSLCDSHRRKAEDISNEIAAKLESTHVHQVYEDIADHFNETRHKPWPNVLDFVLSMKPGSIVVDIGCGNGKYMGINKNVFDMGCDRSFNLLDLCVESGYNVFNCNCLSVPLRDGIADGVICIAVIHHLANEERRKQSISEMIRVLRVGGRALIYVWAKDQNYYRKSSYLKQNRKNRKDETDITEQDEIKFSFDRVTLPIHTNRKQFLHQDLFVPWKLLNEGTISDEFLRYYHVFEENELDYLVRTFDDVEVIESYYEQGNWCIVFEKVK